MSVFLGFHVSHQTTKIYNTREIIDKYHQNHKSKCQTLSHNLVVNMSTNMALSGYQNVNEYARKLISTKINKATIFTLAVRTQYSGGETTSFRRIQLIANMHLRRNFSPKLIYRAIAVTTRSRCQISILKLYRINNYAKQSKFNFKDISL